MKITESYLRNIIREEIKNHVIKEGVFDNIKKNYKKFVGTSGEEHLAELKPVPSPYLQDIYEQATGKPFAKPRGGDYRTQLKIAVSELMFDGIIVHENGKLIIPKTGFSVPDHGKL
jgi:hypothetical protein